MSSDPHVSGVRVDVQIVHKRAEIGGGNTLQVPGRGDLERGHLLGTGFSYVKVSDNKS